MPLLDERNPYGQNTMTGVPAAPAPPQLSLADALRALAALPDHGQGLLPSQPQQLSIGPAPIPFTPQAQSPTIQLPAFTPPQQQTQVVDRVGYLQQQQQAQQQAQQEQQARQAQQQQFLQQQAQQEQLARVSALPSVGTGAGRDFSRGNSDAPLLKYPQGMINSGNIDLGHRPHVVNADGSVSTVRSITVEQDGKFYVLPTVVGDRVVSNDEAIAHWQQTGEMLGSFTNENDAEDYAQKLHDQQNLQMQRDNVKQQIGFVQSVAAPFNKFNNMGIAAEDARRQQQLANGTLPEDSWGPSNTSTPYMLTPEQTAAFGAPPPSREPQLSPIAQNFLSGAGDVAQGAYNAARTEIPGMERVADVAGQIGRRAGESIGGSIGGPFAPVLDRVLPDALTPMNIAGKIGEVVASAPVPTEVWQVAIELVPGIGTVPDLLKGVKGVIPELTVLARNAGMRIEEYVASKQGREALMALLEKRGIPIIAGGSEAGTSKIPGKAAEDVGGDVLTHGTGVKKFVHDPEILDPSELGLAKSTPNRLLPFQTTMGHEINTQITGETIGNKIMKGVRKAGGKRLVDVINPSALNDPTKDITSILTTAYRRTVDQGLQTNKVGMAYLTDRALPFELGADGIVTNLPKGSKFGPKVTSALVPPGTTTGGFEGEHIIDILERATRADVGKNITQDQWTWTVTARQIIDDAKADLFRAHGVQPGTPEAAKVLRELGFSPGEHYFPRRVLGRNGIASAKITGAGARVGSTKFFEKSRVNEYVAQGVADGLNFDNPINAMNTFLGAMRRATADAELVQFGKNLGVTRKAAGVGPDAFVGAMSGIPFGRTGTIPVRESQIAGLHDWLFPADVINTIEAHLLDTGNQFIKSLSRASAPFRFSVAGFDIGTPFINGLPLLFRDAPAWGRAVKLQFEALKDPTVIQKYLLKNRDILQEYLDSGGQLMEPEFLQSLRPGGALQKLETLPIAGAGVKRLEAGRDAFITAGQIEMWKGMRGAARNDADRQMLIGINNDLMGVTGLPRTGISQTQMDVENAVLWFAGRFTKAPVALVGHMLGTRIGAQEAARSLATIAGGGALIMYGLAKAAGMSDSEITTMFDPTSGGKFLSIRVRGNYIGVGGSYRSLIQLIGKSYAASKDDPYAFLSNDSMRNPLLYYFRSRTAPLTGKAWDIATQRDFIGQPINTPGRVLRSVASIGTPSAIDAYIRADGGYIDKLIGGLVAFNGPRTNPLTPGDKVNVAAEEGARAAGYSSFGAMRAKLGTAAAYAELEKSSPKFKDLRKAAVEAGQARREELGQVSLTDAIKPFRDEQATADNDPNLKDPQAWIADRKARNQRQAGGLAIWAKDNPDQAARLTQYAGDPFQLKPDASPDDIAAAYFKVFKMHQTATGGVDDTQALSDDLDKFNANLSLQQQEVLGNNVGLKKTPREQAYAAATAKIAASGYWDRQDAAFEAFRKDLAADSANGPEMVAAAKSWKSLDDMKSYVQDMNAKEGVAPETYDKNPLWNAWERSSTAANKDWYYTPANAPIEYLLFQWGYLTRLHSDESVALYEHDHPGIEAPYTKP